MENNLSSKEIDTLVDALDAWETKDSVGRLMGGMLGAMLMKDDPVAKAKYEEHERLEEEKYEREKRQRRDTSLLLKAKLISIKQNAEIGQLTS